MFINSYEEFKSGTEIAQKVPNVGLSALLLVLEESSYMKVAVYLAVFFGILSTSLKAEVKVWNDFDDDGVYMNVDGKPLRALFWTGFAQPEAFRSNSAAYSLVSEAKSDIITANYLFWGGVLSSVALYNAGMRSENRALVGAAVVAYFGGVFGGGHYAASGQKAMIKGVNTYNGVYTSKKKAQASDSEGLRFSLATNPEASGLGLAFSLNLD